ncbi:hypothetical protein MGYG_07219 [Nannizzia gypsea CBS 118893]|uniref:Uncharacterized protein n=1 Tax=Arthroderma gypseum (strain ATCC MYA-4604 / CBS 118893) TaxID=535722 RepID=E4V2E7_ARTGP|nr:hypothetical protein MGYG_07219 [Nannizzia gypsea CBS 118893]EFR04212.1 hypothetical protein MGYG_07219 [Nannizzia gypsea CBS 118893]
MKPTDTAYLLALSIFTASALACVEPVQQEQRYACKVKPSEEDTKSACQKAKGSFCHPDKTREEKFFCIIDADDNKVTDFEEACKVDIQSIPCCIPREHNYVSLESCELMSQLMLLLTGQQIIRVRQPSYLSKGHGYNGVPPAQAAYKTVKLQTI